MRLSLFFWLFLFNTLSAQTMRGLVLDKITDAPLAGATVDLPGVGVTAREPHRLTLAVDTDVAPIERVVAAALAAHAVRDLEIENPPLDDIIAAIYRGEAGHA